MYSYMLLGLEDSYYPDYEESDPIVVQDRGL